jgi:hypothetical protein
MRPAIVQSTSPTQLSTDWAAIWASRLRELLFQGGLLWSTALTCSLGCRQHGHACCACAACAVGCSLSTHAAWTEDGQWNGNWPIMVFPQSKGVVRRSGRSSRVVFGGVTHRCLRGLSIGNRWATRRELAKVWPVRFGGWHSKRFAAPSGLAQHHYR